MQTIYILINDSGILLGLYRDRMKAQKDALDYIDNDILHGPTLYLYMASSNQVDKVAENRFFMIWSNKK